MKNIVILLTLAVSIIACKKGETGPAGPEGPAGAQGPQGPQGIAGNANVTQYTFGAVNLATGFATLQVTTTLDTMNRSTWFVYLHYAALDRWYIVPGYGPGGSTMYRVSFSHSNGKVSLFIDKVGTGESFAQARVVRVYANHVTTGGRSATELPSQVDFNDYNAVKEFYQLPD